MKWTCLCLLNQGRGSEVFEFSSRREAVDFRIKHLKKYAYVFIYDGVID